VPEPLREKEKNENPKESTLVKAKLIPDWWNGFLFNDFDGLVSIGYWGGGGRLCFCVL
jgi:hypothetical protein